MTSARDGLAARRRGDRRPLLVGALSACLALVISSCGGEPDDPAGAAARSTATSSTSAAAGPQPSPAFPVTVSHVFGQTTIPRQPTRVVTLGLSDQDPLLALGVTPIAVYPWFGDYPSETWPWAEDELGDAKPVVLAGGVRDEARPPIEQIARLEPDLILSLYNGTTKAQYDLLSRIAPTVLPTDEFDDFTITWQEATRVTGRAVGRSARAEELITALDRKFAAAAASHPQFAGKRVVVAERFEDGESVVRTGNDARAAFFSRLGFETPTEVAGAKADEFGEIKVSDELMTSLSRDLLVWNIGNDPVALRKKIEAVPLYKSLPVVQQGKVLFVEDPVVSGAFSWGTVLSLDYALDQLLPQITGTLG